MQTQTKRRSSPLLLRASLGGLLLCGAALALAAEPVGLRIGAALRDITPSADMLPLARVPNVEMTGVLDPIRVRVVALSSGAATVLLVCSETGRSLGPQLAGVLSRHTGIPLEAILFTSTHSHATPELAENWIDLYFEEGSEVTNQQRWAAYAQEQLLAAADDALGDMQSASMGIGFGESFINVNRNAAYEHSEDGKVTGYVNLGFNPTGPTDRTVAAMRFDDEAGKPMAFIINYAVHGTVLHANTILDGKTGISADIPGLVSTWLEQKYPGAVAVWLSGAAGDQAPLIQNQMLTRNPMTGEMEESFTGSYDMLTYLARIHFADVEAALGTIDHAEHDIKVDYDYRDSAIPAKEGGDYGISLQLLRIGDVALVGFPGELFSTLGKDIKQNSPLSDTIVVNHAWQRTYQHPGYHADDAAIARGGFGTRAAYQSGYLSKALIDLSNTMIRETDEWTFNGDGTATNRHGKRVIVGADGAPGTDDDNRLVNPAGSVVAKNVTVAVDAAAVAYVPLGNGFNVYAGQDHDLGTADDIVKGFGRYPQSDPTGAMSDPLNWRLLDIRDGQATLLASAQLDSIQFNVDAGDGNDWTKSNLRAWLNSRGGRNSGGDTVGFFDAAFDADEKARIVATRLDRVIGSAFGGVNPPFVDATRQYRTPAMDVADPVWVLSGEEAIEYFGPSKVWPNPSHDGSYFTNATLVPTDYAHAHGVKINEGHNGPANVGYGDSWLRTPGTTDGKEYYALFLSSLGNLNARRQVDRVYGVLPAITVQLKP